ncbi:protein lethal(2)essential for life-like [Periplaneta americana]|uniref:protein lethal(2)essential for life-like n=1 Tax=Periplaneta americana TaxID=6978 RepID=UPI0037E9BAF4
MSLAPLLIKDIPVPLLNYLFDQHFGRGMLCDELLNPSFIATLRGGYYRPWRNQSSLQSGVSKVQNDNDGFKVNLDVQHFKPDELTMKMVDDFVVVEGKHEEQEDEHGFISRQFQRRYKLPSDVEPDTVTAQLSSDGVLTISAPKKTLPSSGKERVVLITYTESPTPKEADAKGDANSNKIEQ